MLSGGKLVVSSLLSLYKVVGWHRYLPSRVAQRLRAAKSHLIGVIVSDVKNPFYTMVLSGIEWILSEHGLRVLIGSSNSDQDHLIALMKAEEAAGLIIGPVREDSAALADMAENGSPAVVSSNFPFSRIPSLVLRRRDCFYGFQHSRQRH